MMVLASGIPLPGGHRAGEPKRHLTPAGRPGTRLPAGLGISGPEGFPLPRERLIPRDGPLVFPGLSARLRDPDAAANRAAQRTGTTIGTTMIRTGGRGRRRRERRTTTGTLGRARVI